MSFYERFCEPREVSGLGIVLMTATQDRWVVGQQCISGPHEGEMAMWSQPFYGGIRLAQYIMQNPQEFTGKRAVDIGSGSGLVAIAMAKAGAEVTAIDSSACAADIIPVNAALNRVTVEVIEENVCDLKYIYPDFFGDKDIITAADTFYVHRDLGNLKDLLGDLARRGKAVYATSQDEALTHFLAADGVGIEAVGKHGRAGDFVRLFEDKTRIVKPVFDPPLSRPMKFSARLNAHFAAQRRAARLERS